MTAQAMDTIYLDGEEYTIICSTGGELIDPRDWGMPLHYFSTGCSRGYLCSFEISDGSLFLHELGVHSRDGIYPTLNGREAEEPESQYDPLWWYTNVKLPIAYSGVLALGREGSYSFEYYVHMGTQALYSWEDVLGIELVEGKVVQTFSLSDLSAKYRDAVDRSRTKAEAVRVWRMCSGCFGFMGGVFDHRRETVDRYYAPLFEREKEQCAEVLFKRQELGDKGRSGAFPTVPYVPLGCSPVAVRAEHLEGIVNRLEAGDMVKEDMADIMYLMQLVYRHEIPHLKPECSMKDFKKITVLLEKEYFGTIGNTADEVEESRNTYCTLPADKVRQLRRIIREAFGQQG